MATKKQMLEEADQIAANIEAGKVRGKVALKKARGRMYNLRHRAKRKIDKFVLSKAEKAQIKKGGRAIAKEAERLKMGQGFLPEFLPQMDVVRIEELVAQKLFEKFTQVLSQNPDKYNKKAVTKVRKSG